MSKKHRKDHQNREKPSSEQEAPKNIKERITDMFHLPKEVILNLPRISLVGDKEFYIENCKGIMEYSEVCVRMNTNVGIIEVSGRALYVKNITSEEICVQGIIQQIQFVR